MASRISNIHSHIAPTAGACTISPAAAATKKLRVGMVGLGGRGTGTLGTIERLSLSSSLSLPRPLWLSFVLCITCVVLRAGSALLAQKMEMVALADVDPARLEPHKSKGYALFGTASEMIQVSCCPRSHVFPRLAY